MWYSVRCSLVYHQKASERKCAHSSVSEGRKCWTTMDRILRELLLVEVRIFTSLQDVGNVEWYRMKWYSKELPFTRKKLIFSRVGIVP